MKQIFDKIPKSSVEYVRGLISSENIIFKLKKSRRTKHGDFSIKKNGLVIITINEDLNAYRFLITLIHEISHYFSVKNYGLHIKPHGIEWKNTFKLSSFKLFRISLVPSFEQSSTTIIS